MTHNATTPTPLTSGVVLSHPDVQEKWPRDPEQLAVNGIDSGVFINELANIELLPRRLKSFSDGEKKAFDQNPENLLWKAHEQGPSTIREGTYRGTKLALTKAYDLIEQRFMSFMDAANFEPLVPSPLNKEEKQQFFAFTNGSDGYPPHLNLAGNVPAAEKDKSKAEKSTIQPSELFNKMRLLQLSSIVPSIVPSKYIGGASKAAAWDLFGSMGQHPISKDRQTSKSYDILGCTADILDTWGPGNLIFPSTTEAHSDNPIAIQIGDGYIFSTKAGKFHWAQEIKDNEGLIAIDLNMRLTIGALVTVNKSCRLDEAACRNAPGNQWHDLGEYSMLWDKSQRQTGFQVDKRAYRTHGWNKMKKNKPIKDMALENPPQYMDRYFGVQVSYCTGVAKRVPLHTLVADLGPIFSEAVRDVESLRGNTWNDQDSPEILNRMILTSLQPTGFDPSKRKFCVAWPFKGKRCLCLDIPSWRKNSWVEILEDSSDCATFAYITMQCLETDGIKCKDIKCQATSKHTRNMSILETGVTHSSQEGLLPPSKTLQDKKVYVFKMLNNRVWVKALRENPDQPAKLIGLVYSESLPYVIQERLYFTERKKQRNRLLERSTSQDPGEEVSISSIRSSAFQ